MYGFTKHSVYLLGNECVVQDVMVHNPTTDMAERRKRFYCVLSTENLLMNAYRQMATGQDMTIACDASYRYVTERDHGLFVVKAVNWAPSAKTIGYAICNKEDKNALEWIFRTLKMEIERIVNAKIDERRRQAT